MIKITGGEFRGRALITPPTLRTRPTLARLRQALFNSLQTVVPGAHVLDLFAGSGALGFEALSRGAASAIFVEISKPACALIYKNAESLKVQDRIRVINASVEKCWLEVERFTPFDLVLADPPYADGWERKIFNLFPWDLLLKAEGFFSLEWGIHQQREADLPERFPFLVKTRQKLYGDSVLTTFQGCKS